MKKVGATSSGSILVEMSSSQYDALQLVMAGNLPVEAPRAETENSGLKVMAVKRKLDHVRNCIQKLKPSTLEELMRSVRTIHPFTGGFAEKEIEHLLKILVREGLFTVDGDGGVHYEENQPDHDLETKYANLTGSQAKPEESEATASVAD